MAIRIKGDTVIDDSRVATFANTVVQGGYIETGYIRPWFQGSTSGYSSGGIVTSGTNQILRYPFASSTGTFTTDVGTLTRSTYNPSGQSSSVSGYSSGGVTTPPFASSNIIDKFPFASSSNATDVGDLTATTSVPPSGQSSSTHGYVTGTFTGPVAYNINKFPFASDTNASIVGSLSTGSRSGAAGQTSPTSGYSSGGGPAVNIIDKFPFSTDSNATDTGDLTAGRYLPSGQSSTTHGYTTAGNTPTYVNIIDKFSFSTDSNATDVGDLTGSLVGTTGTTSTTHGYATGGTPSAPSPLYVNTISRFPFATDSNSTDVGTLFSARSRAAGQQV